MTDEKEKNHFKSAFKNTNNIEYRNYVSTIPKKKEVPNFFGNGIATNQDVKLQNINLENNIPKDNTNVELSKIDLSLINPNNQVLTTIDFFKKEFFINTYK